MKGQVFTIGQRIWDISLAEFGTIARINGIAYDAISKSDDDLIEYIPERFNKSVGYFVTDSGSSLPVSEDMNYHGYEICPIVQDGSAYDYYCPELDEMCCNCNCERNY